MTNKTFKKVLLNSILCCAMFYPLESLGYSVLLQSMPNGGIYDENENVSVKKNLSGRFFIEIEGSTLVVPQDLYGSILEVSDKSGNILWTSKIYQDKIDLPDSLIGDLCFEFFKDDIVYYGNVQINY